MPPLGNLLAALAIVLVGQLGRAGVDKLLALRHGPDVVAQWAQLQSVVELVSGVVLVGIGQGVTVLVAQSGDSGVQRQLLREALRGGLLLALACASLLLLLPASLVKRLLPGGEALSLLPVAALVGCLAVGAGLLIAFWQGLRQPPRILLLSLVATVPLVVAAWGLPGEGLAFSLLWIQGGVGLLLLLPLLQVLRGASGVLPATLGRSLWRYLPVGLAIGVLSPGSVLLVRSVVSESLSWTDAGLLQAVWRYSEWVTVSVAGILALLFLPRLSAAAGTSRFAPELGRCALWVLTPAVLCLAILFAFQKPGLALLYDARFAVPARVVGLVMLGDVLRMAAWVLLFGLFATGRTRWITVGEFLSLPLYALLTAVLAQGMTLERAAGLYAMTYVVYLAFNAVALRVGQPCHREIAAP